MKFYSQPFFKAFQRKSHGEWGLTKHRRSLAWWNMGIHMNHERWFLWTKWGCNAHGRLTVDDGFLLLYQLPELFRGAWRHRYLQLSGFLLPYDLINAMYFKQRLPKRGVLTMVRTWCPAAMFFAEFPPGAAPTHRDIYIYIPMGSIFSSQIYLVSFS